jgi:hypothetical protein
MTVSVPETFLDPTKSSPGQRMYFYTNYSQYSVYIYNIINVFGLYYA